MRRVQIYERDTTVVDNQAIVTDVVYVPGFALQGPVRVPTYCATLSDFREIFGSATPYFAEAQPYPNGIEGVTDFDNTLAYSVDDLVIYDNVIYTCIVAVTAPEEGSYNENPSVDTTHWEEYTSVSVVFDSIALPNSGGDQSDDDDTNMFDAGNADPGYVFATEMLINGLPVVFERVQEDNEEITVQTMYDALSDIFNGDENSPLLDKNGISIKYITSGGYPTFECSINGVQNKIANAMIQLASDRGDCIAFVDHTNNPDRLLVGEYSVYARATTAFSGLGAAGSFGTMITPWVEVGLLGSYAPQQSITGFLVRPEVPGSFAYLTALAVSLRTNASWLAIAGVARGRIPRMMESLTEIPITNTIAENMTPIYGFAINPITNIRPYGECIWGNRTLLDTTSKSGYATGFLNIRNLVCDVKKQAYVAAMSSLFEQNTDVLWINFKSMIQPMLEQMRTGGGLKNYKIIKLPGSERETIRAKIVLVPVYAVEQFIIEVNITDSDIALEEVSVQTV